MRRLLVPLRLRRKHYKTILTHNSTCRYCTAPKERIITYHPTWLPEAPFKLAQEVREILGHLKEFLLIHQFDPLECFGYDPNALPVPSIKEKETEENPENDGDDESDTDSIAEELKKINDPVEDPLKVIHKFEMALDKFGPWCADRSLILLFQLVDRLKVRTPYERHYLLLGAVYTRLLMVQATFRQAFSCVTPLEALELYSTSKLRAVLQILRRFDLTQTPEAMARTRRRQQSGTDDSENESENDDIGGTSKADNKLNVSNNNTGGGRRRRNRGRNIHRDINSSTITPICQVIKIEDVTEVSVIEKQDASSGKQNDIEKATDITEIPVNGTVANENEGTVAVKKGEPVEGQEEAPKCDKRRRQRFRKKHYATKRIDVVNTPECGTEASEDKNDENNATTETPGPYRRGRGAYNRPRYHNRGEENTLCGLILLKDRFDARLL